MPPRLPTLGLLVSILTACAAPPSGPDPAAEQHARRSQAAALVAAAGPALGPARLLGDPGPAPYGTCGHFTSVTAADAAWGGDAFAVVWETYHQTSAGGMFDPVVENWWVTAARVPPSGPPGGATRVVAPRSSRHPSGLDARAPRVAFDGRGYLVVFRNLSETTDARWIGARRLSAALDGVTWHDLRTATVETATSPAVACGPVACVVVAATPSGNAARAIRTADEAVAPDWTPLSDGEGEEYYPAIAAAPHGFLAAWSENRGCPECMGLRARRLDAWGAPLDDDAIDIVVGTGTGAPVVAYDGQDWHVVWDDADATWGRRVAPDGSLRGAGPERLADRARSLALARAGDGLWLLRRPGTGDGSDALTLAPLTLDGGLRDTDVRPLWADDSWACRGSLAAGGDRLLAGCGALAARLTADGAPVDEAPFHVSDDGPCPALPSAPALAAGPDVALVAWSEEDAGVFAQRVAPDGRVLDATPLHLAAVGENPHVGWAGGQFVVVWEQLAWGPLAATVSRDGVASPPRAIVSLDDRGGSVAGFACRTEACVVLRERYAISSWGQLDAVVLPASLAAPPYEARHLDPMLGGGPALGHVRLSAGGDGYLLAWNDVDHRVRALRLGADGVPLDAHPLELRRAEAEGSVATVAAASDGAAWLVAWRTRTPGSEPAELRATRVSADGAVDTPEGAVVATGGIRFDGRIAAAWDGDRYVVVHHEPARLVDEPASADSLVVATRVPATAPRVPSDAAAPPVVARGAWLTAPLGLVRTGVGPSLLLAWRGLDRRVHVRSLAWACDGAADCGGGPCVDGACCDAPCGGGDPTDCAACSVALGGLADGACAPVRADAICRAAAGPCDEAERCDGAATACPRDDVRPTGAPCRPAAGRCDEAETCDGASPACPDDGVLPAETPCRPAAGPCDAEEVCTGVGSACPPDGFAPWGAACGDPADGPCDGADSCDGFGACRARDWPAGAPCRSLGSDCDAIEECAADGTCPGDAVGPPGPPCGEQTWTACAGPGACAADGACRRPPEPATRMCRMPAGPCDVAEFCDGAGACPPDAWLATGAVCRSPVHGECAAVCDTDGACVAAVVAEGAACEDGDRCTVGDTCIAGGCVPGEGALCEAGGCRSPGACHPVLGCVGEPDPAADGAPCEPDAFECTADVCADGGCAHVVVTGCLIDGACRAVGEGHPTDPCRLCAADGDERWSARTERWPCDDGLFCTEGDACRGGACAGWLPRDCGAVAGPCEAGLCDEEADACRAVALPDGHTCPDDGDPCTDERCLAGACAHEPRSDGCGDGDIVEPGDAVESADVAEPIDVVEPIDVAEPIDIAEPVDIAEPADVVEPADIGEPSDLAEPIDLGEPPPDTAGPVDAAEPADSAGPLDVHAPVDAAAPSDARTPQDGAGPADGVRPRDAAANSDAGPASTGGGCGCDVGSAALPGRTGGAVTLLLVALLFGGTALRLAGRYGPRTARTRGRRVCSRKASPPAARTGKSCGAPVASSASTRPGKIGAPAASRHGGAPASRSRMSPAAQSHRLSDDCV